MDKATAMFISTMIKLLPPMSGVTMQDWTNDPEEFQKFLFGLRSKSKVTLVQKDGDSIGTTEPIKSNHLDYVVKIDRLPGRSSYPKAKKRLMNPELEFSGSREYNLKKEVEQWLHPKQKVGVATGQEIYEYLKKDNALIRCLGLADLLAIKAMGDEVFHELYRGLAVYAWKSVIEDRLGRLYVPCLIWIGGMVAPEWCLLDGKMGSACPALLFKK
jgi:hypothetical protein